MESLTTLLNGKLDGPLDEVSIQRHYHPVLPLVGLKYHKKDSPRLHPIVRQCRGIVLELPSLKVVARPFNRFFNEGEDIECQRDFDWGHFAAQRKEDGTLIIAFWYDGQWIIKTGGSWADGHINRNAPTWQQAFFDVLPRERLEILDKRFTYCFELCTPYNKVVVSYPRPVVFLLGALETIGSVELDDHVLDYMADVIGCERPEIAYCKSKDDLEYLLFTINQNDKVVEGFVLRDTYNRRIKIKTDAYKALHYLKDNGNILRPDRLLPIILENKEQETLAALPELAGPLRAVKTTWHAHIQDIASKFILNARKERKEFALAVKDHPWAWVFFTLYDLPEEKREWPHEVVPSIMAAKLSKVCDKMFAGQVFEYDGVIDE